MILWSNSLQSDGDPRSLMTYANGHVVHCVIVYNYNKILHKSYINALTTNSKSSFTNILHLIGSTIDFNILLQVNECRYSLACFSRLVQAFGLIYEPNI